MPLNSGRKKISYIDLRLIFIMLAAFNMRPALTSIGTAVDQITAALGVGPQYIGFLTMLPPLCFGMAGVIAVRLCRNRHIDSIVTMALLLLSFGLLLRILPLPSVVLAGTILAAFGIGIAGVLLPVIIKQNLASGVGVATGLYTMGMCVGGATAAAYTLALQEMLDVTWNVAVGLWTLPALMAACLWWAFGKFDRGQLHAIPLQPSTGLWRDYTAWSVTCFMGFQAGLAFIVLGWLPIMLQDRGVSPVLAGYVTSWSIMGQLITALAMPALVSRMRSQRPLVVLCLGAAGLGMTGVLLGSPHFIGWWSILLGLGQGGTFGLALVFISLRSADSGTATALSGMSQGIGYMIAAASPLAVAMVRRWSIEPMAQLTLFLAILLVALVSGWTASSERHVVSCPASVNS